MFSAQHHDLLRSGREGRRQKVRKAGRKWEISVLEWAAAAGLVGAEAAGMSAALHSFQGRAWLGNGLGKAQFCSRLVTLVWNGHRDRPCRLRPGIIQPVLLIP